MIVVDSNILIAACLHGQLYSTAQQVIAKGVALAAPHVWRYEVAQFVGKAARAGKITVDQAEAAFLLAESTLHLEEEVADAIAIRESVRFVTSTSDAYFLSLAKAHRTILVTFDARLVRAAPSVAVGPEEYLRQD